MKAWIVDPTILLKHSELTKLWPCSSMNATEKFNTTTRLIIALTVIGFLIMNKLEILLVPMLLAEQELCKVQVIQLQSLMMMQIIR